MPRGNRHFLPGLIWHITHRCHQQAFLLKFSQDRQHYLRWLFDARKRFGLCVLNYMVTSNHVHLLVRDTAPNVISQSIQLIAGPHPPRKPEVLQTVSFRHRLVCVHPGNSDDIYSSLAAEPCVQPDRPTALPLDFLRAFALRRPVSTTLGL
jgi:hypothetical protein